MLRRSLLTCPWVPILLVAIVDLSELTMGVQPTANDSLRTESEPPLDDWQEAPTVGFLVLADLQG